MKPSLKSLFLMSFMALMSLAYSAANSAANSAENSAATEKNKNAAASQNPKVMMETDLGKITIELYPEKAPITVKNFLAYVDSRFYEGVIFHRVVQDFVVQGGGMTHDFQRKPNALPAIKNEASNGLKNVQGSLSMARTSDPDSATSQFFINLKDNTNLDPSDSSAGYAVFGKVIEGFDVVKKIEKEPRGLYRAQPEAPNFSVRILKAYRL